MWQFCQVHNQSELPGKTFACSRGVVLTEARIPGPSVFKPILGVKMTLTPYILKALHLK